MGNIKEQGCDFARVNQCDWSEKLIVILEVGECHFQNEGFSFARFRAVALAVHQDPRIPSRKLQTNLILI